MKCLNTYHVLLKLSSQGTIIRNFYICRSCFLVDKNTVSHFELQIRHMHHARWMGKGIYALKVYLLKAQFKLTVCESKLLLIVLRLSALFVSYSGMKHHWQSELLL